MNEDFTKCRTFGHTWDEVPNTWRPQSGTLITLRCTRCGTIREDVVSPLTGALYGRYYIYPAGYREAPKQNRDAWRKQFLKDRRKTRRLKSA